MAESVGGESRPASAGWRTFGLGAELALRSGLMPFVFGVRWAAQTLQAEFPHAPRPRRDLALFSKVALDEVFFATELATATLVSLRERTRVAAEVHDALALFDARGWLGDPVTYHEDPPAPEAVRIDASSSLFGPYRHLRFESGYAPHEGEPGRERWLGYRPNRTAHAWILEHPRSERPWVVCVPGYRMGHPAVDFTGFRTRWLHRTLGLNVAVAVLPFHGPRRVGRRGGDGYLSGDFLDTLHAEAQAAWDVRRLLGWLRRRAPAVALYGVSLGGYTAALIAALEARIDAVIAGIPAADFLRLFRDHAPERLVRAVQRAGFPLTEIERLMSVISPLHLRPRVPRERRYLYAGLADRLATPRHAFDLWEHWDRPRLVWYDGSHVSFLWEKKVEALLREALSAHGLVA